MKKTFEQKTRLALIVFTAALAVTMGLHPTGGSPEYLLRISSLIIVTHSIAIASLPLGWVGFCGLTRRIGTDHFGSVFAFALISLGIVAAMFAAAANGLILQFFLHHYRDESANGLEAIKPFLKYNIEVNHAFDYIYTGTFYGAILCWSVAILYTRKLARWIGWLGIGLSAMGAIVFVSGTAVNNLMGLRVFITSVIGWIVIVGAGLWRRI